MKYTVRIDAYKDINITLKDLRFNIIEGWSGYLHNYYNITFNDKKSEMLFMLKYEYINFAYNV